MDSVTVLITYSSDSKKLLETVFGFVGHKTQQRRCHGNNNKLAERRSVQHPVSAQ